LWLDSPIELREVLDAAQERVRRGTAEARRLLAGLQPPLLDEGGIIDAVRFLISVCKEESGVQVELQCNGQFARDERELERSVFRIVQEALNNVARHSNSKRSRIRLTQTASEMTVDVEDWGVGFDPRQVRPGSFGLKGIRERARLFGGHATVDSSPGNGTRIQVVLRRVSQTASDATQAT
jgi:signal transduction histidine kinase